MLFAWKHTRQPHPLIFELPVFAIVHVSESQSGSFQRPRYTISPVEILTNYKSLQGNSSTGTYNTEIHMSLIRLKILKNLRTDAPSPKTLTNFTKRRWKFEKSWMKYLSAVQPSLKPALSIRLTVESSDSATFGSSKRKTQLMKLKAKAI